MVDNVCTWFLTLSIISTQESSQTDNGPVKISIYSLNSRAKSTALFGTHEHMGPHVILDLNGSHYINVLNGPSF